MDDFALSHFHSPEELSNRAEAVFAKEKTLLESLFPFADIQHVGSSAIPGAWGKFDVDIQVRISLDKVEEVTRALLEILPPKHPEIWNAEFSVFRADPESPVDSDYMVTAIDSKYDDYFKIRDTLIARPDLLKAYNDLKKSFEGKPYHEYRTAKKQFMLGIGGGW